MLTPKAASVINQNVDFILRVSPYTTSVTLSKDCTLVKDCKHEDNIKQVIEELISEGELLQLKRLKKCILLFDFGPIACKKIKINKEAEINLPFIKSKLEDEMNYKLFANFSAGNDGDYRLLKSLIVKRDYIQNLTDIVCSIGIEVLEAKPDFLFLLNHVDLRSFIFAKISPMHLEYASINEGRIQNYLTCEKFGFENIFKELCSIFNKSYEDLVKISCFYKSYSLTERLKIYYKREKEDFNLREMIESNKFISLFNIELKRIMNRMKTFIYNDFKTAEEPIVFHYEESLKASKIHTALMDENIFDFESFNLKVSFEEERQKMVAVFAGGFKKIFNLSS